MVRANSERDREDGSSVNTRSVFVKMDMEMGCKELAVLGASGKRRELRSSEFWCGTGFLYTTGRLSSFFCVRYVDVDMVMRKFD